jgi:Ca-activated chloride channel family protein
VDLIGAAHAFHFLRPYWLLALPPLWLLWGWMARHRARDGDWSMVIDAELLADLWLDAGERRRDGGSIAVLLAWTLATLALAGPSWQRIDSPAYRAPASWIIVLDLSPSMAASDLAPSRATRARYAISDLLDAAHDARVGLVVFSDEPYTVTPLTDDTATIRGLLPPLAPDLMPSSGDAVAPALAQASALLASAPPQRRDVIVLSDGFDDPAAAFAQAAKLRAAGIRVDVVGIGTTGGAPVASAQGGFVKNAQGQPALARLDRTPLEQLAQSGGGRYVDLAQLPSLIATLNAQTELPQGATRAGPGVKIDRWRDAGVWLLPVVLLCAAWVPRRGWQ